MSKAREYIEKVKAFKAARKLIEGTKPEAPARALTDKDAEGIERELVTVQIEEDEDVFIKYGNNRLYIPIKYATWLCDVLSELLYGD